MSVGKVAFTGNIPKVVKSVNPRLWAKKFTEEKELKKEMLEAMPKAIKLLDKMKNFVGEVPNIIISAIGTGLIAPFFIKHNFLSKADEDTRTYSAWRQPISAGLAVVTQAGLVIPFNSMINKATNSGKFIYQPQNYNKTAYQDVEYLEKIIKKENPNLPKAEITKLAKDRQYKQLEDIIEQLYYKNTVKYSVKGTEVNLTSDEVKKLLNDVTDAMSKNTKEGSIEKAVTEEMRTAIKKNKSIKEIWKISSKIPESNFVYDVAQKYISNTSANIKGMKQLTGLVVSLAILPVTCSLLNYIYPRFMKAFFPRLADKKEKKHQDTFVKNNQVAQIQSETIRQGGAK